jgi:hypothetical protein
MAKGRWKPPKGPDELRRHRERERHLADILSYGTEEDFVEAVKAYDPEVSEERLRELIMQFRAAVRVKRGLC